MWLDWTKGCCYQEQEYDSAHALPVVKFMLESEMLSRTFFQYQTSLIISICYFRPKSLTKVNNSGWL